MWICKECNEKIEDNFDECWNCAVVTDDSVRLSKKVIIENKNKKAPFFDRLLGAFLGVIIGVAITELLKLDTNLLTYALMVGGYYGTNELYKNKENKNKKTSFGFRLAGAFLGVIIGVAITELLKLDTYILTYALMVGGFFGTNEFNKNKKK